jgi:hypothetical protein
MENGMPIHVVQRSSAERATHAGGEGTDGSMRECNGDSGSDSNRTEHLSQSEQLARWAMPLDRPSAAPAWLPDWAVRLNPGLQVVALIGADFGFVQAPRLDFGTQLLHSMPPCAQHALGLLFADDSLGGYLLLSLLCVCVVNWLSDALTADQPPVWSVPPSERTKIPLVACLLIYSFAMSNLFEVSIVVLAISSGMPSCCGMEVAFLHVVWLSSSFQVLGCGLFLFWQSDGGSWVSLRWRSCGCGGYSSASPARYPSPMLRERSRTRSSQ